jgi:hypothetical protein
VSGERGDEPVSDLDQLHGDQGPGGTAGGESFRLEIRALRSTVPVFVRLRAVCKRLLRQHDFRLTEITETTPPLPPLPPGPADEAQGEGLPWTEGEDGAAGIASGD